jgi:hypothetical protein
MCGAILTAYFILVVFLNPDEEEINIAGFSRPAGRLHDRTIHPIALGQKFPWNAKSDRNRTAKPARPIITRSLRIVRAPFKNGS